MWVCIVWVFEEMAPLDSERVMPEQCYGFVSFECVSCVVACVDCRMRLRYNFVGFEGRWGTRR